MTFAPRNLAPLTALAAFTCHSPLHADVPDEAGTGPDTAAAAIRVIVDNHPESPVPQQLALTAARSFLRQVGSPAGLDLAKQAGKLDSPEEIAEFLRALDRTRPGNLKPEPVWTGVLEDLAGSCQGTLIPARDAEVNESISSNRYVGTGIVLTLQDGYPTMAKVIAEGPAGRAGARDGDRIISIDREDTKDWDIRRSIDALRGERGSKVTVELLAPRAADSQAREYTITRDVVPFESVEALEPLTGAGRGIGYARITSIRSSTVHELRKIERAAVEANLRAVILDLRRVGGGRVHDTVLLASAFLDGGAPIGRQRSAEGERDHHAEAGRLFDGMTVAILIDPTTSGPGEWLAGAIARNEAALLVGLPTAGNPVANQSFEIPGSGWVIDLPHTLLEGPGGAPLSTDEESKRADPNRVRPDVMARSSREGNGPPAGNRIVSGERRQEMIDDRDVLNSAIEALRGKIGS